jgi:hypothetical protein
VRNAAFESPAATDQLEEEVRSIGRKGQITELVWLGMVCEPLLEPAFAVALGELRHDRGAAQNCTPNDTLPSKGGFRGFGGMNRAPHRLRWFLDAGGRSFPSRD